MTSLLLYALFPRVKRKELTSFTISSAGPEGGSAASIQIGGQEYAIGARGFNVVVYDCEKNLVLDSKCFDTYEFVHKVLIDNQLVYAMDVENYLIENK